MSTGKHSRPRSAVTTQAGPAAKGRLAAPILNARELTNLVGFRIRNDLVLKMNVSVAFWDSRDTGYEQNIDVANVVSKGG